MKPPTSTVIVRRHPLDARNPLVIEEDPASLPDDTFSSMTAAYRDGRLFSGYPRDGIAEVGVERDPTSALLIQGSWLVGNASRGKDKKTGRHKNSASVTESSEAIKRFVRAFLAMRPPDRRKAFEVAKDTGKAFLPITMVGAFCEAHVASVLLRAGMTVLESTTHEDTVSGIDAIALLPNGTGGHLVQVKGGKAFEGIEFLRIDRSAESVSCWRAAARFNQSNFVDLTPIMARIGTGRGNLFAYDVPRHVQRARSFIDRLRQPV